MASAWKCEPVKANDVSEQLVVLFSPPMYMCVWVRIVYILLRVDTTRKCMSLFSDFVEFHVVTTVHFLLLNV